MKRIHPLFEERKESLLLRRISTKCLIKEKTMEENVQNEQILNLDEEQLQDINGGDVSPTLRAKYGINNSMSRRTFRPPQDKITIAAMQGALENHDKLYHQSIALYNSGDVAGAQKAKAEADWHFRVAGILRNGYGK
jgi:TolA-binding protein